MDTKMIDVQVVSLDLHELLNLLQTHAEIVLMRGDKPVARISSLETKPIEKRPRIPVYIKDRDSE